MHKQKELFPDRVKIIKKSNLNDQNYPLDAIKELIAAYENKGVSQKLEE